jgi:hypothetical protein
MKNYKQVTVLFMLLVCLIFSLPASSAGDGGKTKKAALNIGLPQPIAVPAVTPSRLMPDGSPLSGSIVYAVNGWTSKLYSFNIENPGIITIIGPASYQAYCSDFLPGDTQHMWIINYLDNSLEKVDITTGQATFISAFPCPLTDGVWSCLSIHKTTGFYYAIATDGYQSVLYRFEPYTGAILSTTNLNIEAAISSSFDYSGVLYVFDIASDSIFTVDVVSGTATALGSAGFNGNYAQGMGYDPSGDEVYLAAFASPGGPQLRWLDRATGNTIYRANLPGSTCAFSFPAEFFAPFANAGSDATISENQTWLLANASAEHYSSLLWKTNGDGHFINPNQLHPTYHPGTADISSGTVRLCLTAIPLGPGMDSVADCMTLTITPVPSGLDFGDAPETGGFFSFATTLANNGACHVINPAIFLGSHIDGEPDGQPNAAANGDDIGQDYPSPYDDEDGVTLPASAAAGSVVTVHVVASVAGFLDGWMDFDLDNTWYAPDEQIFSLQPLTAGMNVLTFLVPATAVQGQSYLRFRFHVDNTPLSFDGMADNGEVEDYAMMITENTIDSWDFGDAPQGDGTHFYPTLLSSNGARHHFVPGINLGSFVDVEPDGQPNAASNGDDTDASYPSLGDDEDGVVMPALATPGSIINLTVYASVVGYLDAWMDFNRNGSWNNQDEHIFAIKPLTGGINYLTLTIPNSASPGQTYVRFRFRNDSTALSYDGIASNGEVEDYTIEIQDVPAQGWDFGDAPEGGSTGMFPTLLSSNGARHVIVPGIHLGNMVDGEPDGQPGVDAGGDDVDRFYHSSGDDEDGVAFTSLLNIGQTASVTVTASTNGFLDAWIDYNGDGTWSSANEHIFTSRPVSGGINALSFQIPSNAAIGTSYARFRFRTSSSPVTFTGLVGNGEVEDYKISICDGSVPPMDFGDAPEDPAPFSYTFPTTLAQNGAAHVIVPGIYLGNFVDGEPDGQPSSGADGDDVNFGVPSSGDDEDGVILPASAGVGSPVPISVKVSVAGFLDAWMDFDQDHTWFNPTDQIFNLQPLAAGINALTFIVPASAVTGQSYLRFRFHTDSNPLPFDGIAYNGEVEDYTIEIAEHIVPVTITVTGNVGDGQTTCYNATQTIIVAGNGTTFTVQNGGDATFIAGQKISFLPGTMVLPGGSVLGRIAPEGPYCGGAMPALPAAVAEQDEAPVSLGKAFFSIYPNPTTGGFSLELTGPDKTADIRVDMYGMYGERLLSATLKGQTKYDFSLAGKPVGVYFIRVVTGKHAGTGKIIRQ